MKGKFFIKLGITLSAVMFLITSCYEDKGNYNYKPINEITFEGIEEIYSIAYGESLEIKPTIIQSVYDNEDNYKYYWLLLGPSGQSKVDTLHKEKYIDGVYLEKLTIGVNKVVYQVYDPVRNVEYTSDYFTVEVANDIKQGFMLLLNDGGETDLRFLNYTPATALAPARVDMKNVSLTSLPELGAPVGIRCYHCYASPMAGGYGYTAAGVRTQLVYAISLVTETGLYRFNPADHRYEDAMHGKYVITGSLDQFKITGIEVPVNRTYTTQQSAYLKDGDGNIMYYRGGAGAALTIVPWSVGVYCNRYAITGTDGKITGYKRFTPFKDFAAVMNWTAVLYDMDSRSFVFKGGNNNFCERFTMPETLFKLNDNDASFEPLWLTVRVSDTHITGGYLNTAYALVKNTSSGNINLLLFGVASAAAAESQQKIIKLWPQTETGRVLTNFNNAKRYAIHAAGNNASYANLFYYATDTEIYVYDLVDGVNKKVFPLDGDEPGRTIVEMKFVIQQQVTGTNFFQHHLIIATKGNGDNSTNVGIYEVKANDGALNVKSFTNTTTQEVTYCKWEGLPDYVDMDWKAKP